MNIEYWKNTGILNGVSKDKIDDMAYALESQRIFNQINKLNSFFLRISIPLIRRILSQVEFKPSLNDNLNITNIIFDPPQSYNLDAEAHYTANLAEKIVDYIKNQKEFYFKAFTLVDNKIAVIG